VPEYPRCGFAPRPTSTPWARSVADATAAIVAPIACTSARTGSRTKERPVLIRRSFREMFPQLRQPLPFRIGNEATASAL